MKLPRDLLVTSSAIPTYHRLAGHLRDLIVGGTFAPDEQLPSEEAIAGHLFVSRPTVRHALHQLSEEHLLRRVHGRGTFVNDQLASRPDDSTRSRAPSIPNSDR